jgi:hypothetical protein
VNGLCVLSSSKFTAGLSSFICTVLGWQAKAKHTWRTCYSLFGKNPILRLPSIDIHVARFVVGQRRYSIRCSLKDMSACKKLIQGQSRRSPFILIFQFLIQVQYDRVVVVRRYSRVKLGGVGELRTREREEEQHEDDRGCKGSC